MLKKINKISIPRPLHREADFSAIVQQEQVECSVFLGSFWPYNTSNYESSLVKSFKESVPVEQFNPEINTLCDFYASSIFEKLPNVKIDFIARALSSSETTPDPKRPQSLLVKRLCRLTKARDASGLFYRSQARTPMRAVQNLSGSAAFRQRLKYAAQDLFVKEEQLCGRVLFVDDIANTGATVQLYAWALKQILGATNVMAANIAVTRFGGGKDGKGFLELDTSQISAHKKFSAVYKDQSGAYHSAADCLTIEGKLCILPLYYASRRFKPCPQCVKSKK